MAPVIKNNWLLLIGILSGNNVIESFIRQNDISHCRQGIVSAGGFSNSANNTLLIEVNDNRVTESIDAGIAVTGGVDHVTGNTVSVMIQGNIATSNGSGVSVSGGNDTSTDNQIMTDIRGNEVKDSAYAGIGLDGGGLDAEGNTVDGAVMDNQVSQNYSGVNLEGGFEATNNLLSSRVQNNILQDSQGAGVAMAGGLSATANVLNAEIQDNTVSDTGYGIFICGGSAERRGNNSSPANNNSALVNLLTNIIQRSGDLGIAVFGGCDPEVSSVADNRAEATLVNNQADRVDCQDNIAGNTADCTFSENTTALNDPGFKRAIAQQTASSLASSRATAQRILKHQTRIQARERRLRALAVELQDSRLSQRLLRLSDRLRDLNTQLDQLAPAL